MFDQEIDIADMDETVAQGDRHGRIDLGDDRPGGLHRFLGHVHGDSETHVPVLVRRGNLNQGGVDLQTPVIEQPGDVGNENGDILRPALPDRLPGSPAGHEKSLDPEVVAQPGGGITGVANRQDMQNLHVIKVFRLLDQPLH